MEKASARKGLRPKSGWKTYENLLKPKCERASTKYAEFPAHFGLNPMAQAGKILLRHPAIGLNARMIYKFEGVTQG